RLQGDWSSDVCSSDLTVRRFRLDLMADGEGAPALAEKLLRALPAVVNVDVLPDHLEFTAGEAFLEDEAIAKLVRGKVRVRGFTRSEEHTSELQSPCNL